MSYQALYRVWRPQTFADVIGQTAITQTLRNALQTGQTSHAYLFTGPRGTGKTSVAKILAKALNCEHLQDGEPDNTCATCVAINQGSLTDVIEIDAASNNGVDEIRDIRDKAKYAPTQARVKVYIIDEVHMLSTGAFNALLKTLEEPPAHVVFILATTEPQKIPATIQSRTQRFDFRRITSADLEARMRFILDDKGITYDDDALAVIASAAEGGMRDALSILDQVLSFGDNHVTVDNALAVTGGVAASELGAYLTAVTSGDTAGGLTAVAKLLAMGKDAGRLIEDLIGYLRDLLVYQQAPDLVAADAVSLRDEHFQALANDLSPDRIYAAIAVLNDTQQQLRLTNHPALYLQVATVRLGAKPAPAVAPAAEDDAAVTALRSQVASLQESLAKLQQGGGNTGPAPTQPRRRQPAAKVNTAKLNPILAAATKADLTAVRDIWPDLLSALTVTKRAIMKASTPVAASPDGVIASFKYDILVERAENDAALMTELEAGLQRLMGKTLTVVLVQEETWPKLRQAYLQSHGAPHAAKAKPDPAATAAKPLVDLFGSAVKIEDD